MVDVVVDVMVMMNGHKTTKTIATIKLPAYEGNVMFSYQV